MPDPVLLPRADGPRETIKITLMRAGYSGRVLTGMVNDLLPETRRRSEKSVSDYISGTTVPAVDWIVACEDVLKLDRGTLVEGFAARKAEGVR